MSTTVAYTLRTVYKNVVIDWANVHNTQATFITTYTM
jgi:hypothetical protein